MKWCLWLLFWLAAPPALAATCTDLVLSWGTYAGQIDANGNCKYANVRFASPPVESLRFAAPQTPTTDLPLAVGNPGCIAVTGTACLSTSPDIGNQTSSKSCLGPLYSNVTEDCLFLDIYVPQAAIGLKNLPVVVWFYGGGYVSGSKTQFNTSKYPLYSGDGLVDTKLNGQPIIFVAGLGAFGWLAGSYMEKHGQPNAGLLDQRKILELVNENIGQLGGDPKQISVWGESAGASSILHHLVARVNKTTPTPELFQRVIMQSPAYQFLWDRTGFLNQTFTNFTTAVARYAKCAVADMDCIRNADVANITAANQIIAQEASCTGMLPVGPAVDGEIVLDIPTNLFYNGQFKPLDSIIVSHVHLEVPDPIFSKKFSFIPLPIRKHRFDPKYFTQFLNVFMSGDEYQTIRDKIANQYPSQLDQVIRAQHMIMDSSFLCNARAVIDAYLSKKTPVYAMDYAFLKDLHAATHASDLLPIFVNAQTNYTEFLRCSGGGVISWDNAREWSDYLINEVGHGMQSYFVSHAVSGDPNKGAQGPATAFPWLRAQISAHGEVMNVLQPSLNQNWWNHKYESAFLTNKLVDPQTTETVCGFWRDVAKNVTVAYNKANDIPTPNFSTELVVAGDQIVLENEL